MTSAYCTALETRATCVLVLDVVTLFIAFAIQFVHAYISMEAIHKESRRVNAVICRSMPMKCHRRLINVHQHRVSVRLTYPRMR